MSEQHGYEEDFVDEPHEHLKCIICHFVLRNPVQIMLCGHRYCEACFERIKRYSGHFKSGLCCPIDREEIDVSQVFKDTGMRRLIADLYVRCPFNVHGCIWMNELRYLEDHKKQCGHAINEEQETNECVASGLADDNGKLLKQILERLDKCEEGMYQKEKDLAYFKFCLQEMKETINEREKAMEVLTRKNFQMNKEIDSLKEANKIHEENAEKVSSNENAVAQLEAKVQAVTDELSRCKNNVSQDNITKEIIKDMEKDVKDGHEQMCKIGHGMKANHDNVTKALNDVTAAVEGLETDVIISQESIVKVSKEINELQGYVNHTNTLLSFTKIAFKETTFVWTIPDFKEKFDAKEISESSKFYCRPKGHLCQLFSRFSRGTSVMKPVFRLCKGENSGDPADFEMNVTCDLLYNDGTKVSDTFTSADICMYEYFTFKDNKDVTRGMRFNVPLKKDDMEHYLIDNTCTFICTIAPPNSS